MDTLPSYVRPIPSPGLSRRGRTPRIPSGLSHEQAYPCVDTSPSCVSSSGYSSPSHIEKRSHIPIPEHEGYSKVQKVTPYSDNCLLGLSSRKPKHYSALKSFLMGCTLTSILFGVLLYTGFFDRPAPNDFESHGLRGTFASTGTALNEAGTTHIRTTVGQKIPQAKLDYHKSRVLIVPALRPFSRRNVHTYTKHDEQGRLIPKVNAEGSTINQAISIERVRSHHTERRAAIDSAADLLSTTLSPTAKQGTLLLPSRYVTTGVAQFISSITGVDDHHHFDVNDYFASSVTSMGTDPGTGFTTLAVGAPGALENSGMIYFLSLNQRGEVATYTYLTRADHNLGNFWTSNVALGWTVENIGDLDGDGNPDLAVGAIGYPHGSSMGAVYILFMTARNEIKDYKVITNGQSGFSPMLKDNSCFGSSIARLGDLDGDGVTELVVGAMGLGKQRGGLYILYMNKDGSVKETKQISSMHGWDHKLNVEDQFGHAVRAIGDLDGDGVTELAVGADGFPSGDFHGAVWILYLSREGTVKRSRRLNELDTLLEPESLFGGSIDLLGDLDGDGMPEIIVGAPGTHDFRGDAYIISLTADAEVKDFKSMVDRVGVLGEHVHPEDEFAWSLCNIGDINGDGIPDLAVGAETSPENKNYGSLHIVMLAPQ